jgi:dienelactone hydrolase
MATRRLCGMVLILGLAVAGSGCSGARPPSATPGPAASAGTAERLPEADGVQYPVGVRLLELQRGVDRPLPTLLFYPAATPHRRGASGYPSAGTDLAGTDLAGTDLAGAVSHDSARRGAVDNAQGAARRNAAHLGTGSPNGTETNPQSGAHRDKAAPSVPGTGSPAAARAGTEQSTSAETGPKSAARTGTNQPTTGAEGAARFRVNPVVGVPWNGLPLSGRRRAGALAGGRPGAPIAPGVGGTAPRSTRPAEGAPPAAVLVAAGAGRIAGSGAGRRPAVGRFPLVLFSHGMSGSPERVADALASWAAAGFIVAAPSYPYTKEHTPDYRRWDIVNQPNDARFVLTQVVALNGMPGEPLRGRIDVDHIAAVGHSAGGYTTTGLFVAGHDPRLRAAVVLSGWRAPGAFAGPPAQMLFLQGTVDRVVPVAKSRAAYYRVPWPKRYLLLRGVSHANYLRPGDLGYPRMEHVVLGFLRWTLKDDHSDGSLAAD